MLKIREVRLEKGLTQKDLANQLNITNACVSSWETGKTEPSIQDLIELSHKLEVSVDYLLGNSNDFGIVDINSNTLTENEKNIISSYRILNDENKKIIEKITKSLL